MPKTQLINGEPGIARTKKVEITMPEGLYDLLEKVSNVWGETVDQYTIKSLVMILGSDLETDLGTCIGKKTSPAGAVISIDREDVKSLAWPEEAVVQEVYV